LEKKTDFPKESILQYDTDVELIVSLHLVTYQ